MTITIDLTNNLVNITLALAGFGITIGTTWYFTRRHYTKETRPPTDNDVAMQDRKWFYRTVVISLVGLFLFAAFLVGVLALSVTS